MVILKPKQTLGSIETIDIIKKNIKPNEVEVGITNIRPLKEGGVAIGCNTTEQMVKLEAEVISKLGNTFLVKKSSLQNPKIKIVGLGDELNEEDLKICLKKQNPSLKDINGTFKLLVCKKMKKRYLAIVEVDPEVFAEIMRLKTVFIQWCECDIYEHISIYRCFKCGGYNHTSEKCNENPPKCLNCGRDDHPEKDCINDPVCINCSKVNKNQKLNLTVNHSRFDYDCAVYKRLCEIGKTKIRYSI